MNTTLMVMVCTFVIVTSTLLFLNYLIKRHVFHKEMQQKIQRDKEYNDHCNKLKEMMEKSFENELKKPNVRITIIFADYTNVTVDCKPSKVEYYHTVRSALSNAREQVAEILRDDYFEINDTYYFKRDIKNIIIKDIV